MGGNGSTSFTSTCSGVSGAAISGADSTNARTPRALAHVVINPASGASKTAKMQWTTAQDALLLCAVYNGADQTTPFSNGGTANGSGTAPSIAAAGGATGDLSFAGVNTDGSSPSSPSQTIVSGPLDNGSHVSETTRGGQNATHSYATIGGVWVMVVASARQAATGIAFDAASNSGYQTAQSSYTWNHTCTGANLDLLVGVGMLSVAGSNVQSVTYKGVDMAFVDAKASLTGAIRAEMWQLVGPPTGTNAVIVTLSAALDSGAGAVSLTGVNQALPSEANNEAQATNVGAADATVAVTTVADNDWTVDICATDDTAITIGGTNTSRANVTGTLGSAAMGTDGPKTPAGSVTMSWTNVGALQTWAIVSTAIRPTTASGDLLMGQICL